ncbi:Uncharacterised protein [Bordetella pertussis]|nr:Uncharacterised protein [Bordetella pertussis]
MPGISTRISRRSKYGSRTPQACARTVSTMVRNAAWNSVFCAASSRGSPAASHTRSQPHGESPSTPSAPGAGWLGAWTHSWCSRPSA